MWSANDTATILLLIVLSSFVVSYGVICRGLFRDYDALKKDLEDCEDEIREFNAPFLFEPVDEALSEYGSQLTKILVHDGRRRNWLFFPFRWKGRDSQQVALDEMTKLTAEDEILEPELVGEIFEAIKSLNQTRAVILNLEKTDEEIKQEVTKLKQNGEELDIRLQNEQDRLISRSRQHLEEASRIEQQYAELIMRGDTAYRMGAFLRHVLSAGRRVTDRVDHETRETSGNTTAGQSESGTAAERGDGGVDGLRRKLEQISSLIQDNDKKGEERFRELKDRLEKGGSLTEADLASIEQRIKSG